VTERFKTSVMMVDRQLGGGVPAERMVAFVASPTSQSESLLLEMAAQYPTVYLTTERPVPAVRSTLREAGSDPETHTVQRVDPETPVIDSLRYVRQLPEESVLIVDPVDLLERADEAAYREFLDTLRTRLDNTGSIAVFHCLDGERVPAQRDRTTYTADIVFEFATGVQEERVETHLTIPKVRNGEAFEKAMRLEFGRSISVDRSRDIA